MQIVRLVVAMGLLLSLSSQAADTRRVILTGYVYEECQARGFANCEPAKDPQKAPLALVSDKDYTVWTVTNAEKIRTLLGKHVQVTGELKDNRLRIGQVSQLPDPPRPKKN